MFIPNQGNKIFKFIRGEEIHADPSNEVELDQAKDANTEVNWYSKAIWLVEGNEKYE